MSEQTTAQLVAESTQIDDYIKQQTAALAEFLKPYRDRAAEIDKLLLERMISEGVNSFKTDFGTAYRSTIITPKIEDRNAYLAAVFDNWQTYGAGMLQIGAPKKEAIDEYQKEHEGALPPGVTTTSFTRVNVRRS